MNSTPHVRMSLSHNSNGDEWSFMIKENLAYEIRLGQPCDFKMWDGLKRVSSTMKPDVGFYTVTERTRQEIFCAL